jgi:hypothetical protein
MVVLGLLAFLAAVGLAFDVAWQNTASIRVDALGQAFTVSPGWTFAIGAMTGVFGLIGGLLFLSGLARAHRRRLAVKASHGAAEELQAERDRLAAALEAERAARARAEGGRRVDLTKEEAVDLTKEEAGADQPRRPVSPEPSLVSGDEAEAAPRGLASRARLRSH